MVGQILSQAGFSIVLLPETRPSCPPSLRCQPTRLVDSGVCLVCAASPYILFSRMPNPLLGYVCPPIPFCRLLLTSALLSTISSPPPCGSVILPGSFALSNPTFSLISKAVVLHFLVAVACFLHIPWRVLHYPTCRARCWLPARCSSRIRP